MGHKHYAVNNDTLITFPRGKTHEVNDPFRTQFQPLLTVFQGVHFTPGFHSETIPVYAPAVADMIRLRLTQPLEDVED